MMESRSSPMPWRCAAVVWVVVGLPIVAAVGWLVLHAWALCRVGINDTANELSYVFFYTPQLTFALGVAVFLSFKVFARRSALLAIVAAMVLMIGVGYAATLWATPDDYPADACVNNVPYWWPAWLPT